jgi:hypothetical protein
MNVFTESDKKRYEAQLPMLAVKLISSLNIPPFSTEEESQLIIVAVMDRVSDSLAEYMRKVEPSKYMPYFIDIAFPEHDSLPKIKFMGAEGKLSELYKYLDEYIMTAGLTQEEEFTLRRSTEESVLRKIISHKEFINMRKFISAFKPN